MTATDGKDDLVKKAVHDKIVQEIEIWRQQNARDRAELTERINLNFGFTTFPVQRHSPILTTADYTADGIPFTKEKGVDNRIATDIIADAVYNIYDWAIIIASDADFVPPIEFVVGELKKTVIQIGLPQFSRRLGAVSSHSIDLSQILSTLAASPTVRSSGSETQAAR